MEKKQIDGILRNHLPEKAVSSVVDLIIQNKVYLNITGSRSSKYGDFRVPGLGQNPKLSINYNLNPYAFLITLLHEIAHLLVWRNHQSNYRQLKPHGLEWKSEFKLLMRPFLLPEIFPEPLLIVLKRHMLNPKASSSSDIHLLRELKKWDLTENDMFILADFKTGDTFVFRNSTFRIIKKNRSRFLCENLATKRRYLIHSMAEVKMVQDNL